MHTCNYIDSEKILQRNVLRNTDHNYLKIIKS